MGANSLLNTHNICPTTNKMETFWLACFRAFQFSPSPCSLSLALALSSLRLLSLSLSCASCASCAFRNKDLYCCVWQREPESCNRLLACLLVNYSMTSVGVRARAARGSRRGKKTAEAGGKRARGSRLAARKKKTSVPLRAARKEVIYYTHTYRYNVKYD